jgi:DNA-binding IclR family transcriptional regulator
MTRSRVMRLAGTLQSKGFLSYNPDQKKYRLGSRLLTLGKIYEANNDLISHARPVLRRLAELTGESAALYAIDGLKRITLACEKGTQGIQYNVAEGEHKELYAGAAGKVLLAFGSAEVRSEIFKVRKFKRFTPNSIVDPKKFLSQLTATHEQGYAFSEGERIADAFAIAVPVFNHEHKCCAALGIAGPINRFPSDMRYRNLKIVQELALTLSERLGAILNKENNPEQAA